MIVSINVTPTSILNPDFLPSSAELPHNTEPLLRGKMRIKQGLSAPKLRDTTVCFTSHSKLLQAMISSYVNPPDEKGYHFLKNQTTHTYTLWRYFCSSGRIKEMSKGLEPMSQFSSRINTFPHFEKWK